ncbi:MAG: protein kinase domain-containing protein [Myxococcales bacterium]
MAAENPGKYRLIRRLGQGGMAEVFLASQQGLAGFEKTVVVKRILPHLAADAELRVMFMDEARLLARLSHPNVVQVLDFGEMDGTLFIAMEHLAGEDLTGIVRASRAKGEAVPSQVAGTIFAGACEALQYVHTLTDEAGQPLNVVHRDISPSNVFVTYQGAVKLLDFGIAKAEGKIVETKTGKLKGKYAYMSPEHVRGERIDGRSDLFALGAVFYETMTGERLFKRDSELGMVKAILDEPIPRVSQRRAEIAPQLDAIIAKSLARNREEPFQSATEMREALDQFLAVRPHAPAAVLLKGYLSSLFGEEHVRERVRPQGTGSHPSLPGLALMDRDAALAAGPAGDATPPSAELEAAFRPPRRWIAAVSSVAVVLLGLGLWAFRPAPEPAPAAPPAVPALPLPAPHPALALPVLPEASPAPAEVATPPPSAADPPRRKARAGGFGLLSVNCIPWCRIYVDGQDTGKNSPATAIRLKSGAHKLRVVNPPTGRAQEKAIRIAAGRSKLETIEF